MLLVAIAADYKKMKEHTRQVSVIFKKLKEFKNDHVRMSKFLLEHQAFMSAFTSLIILSIREAKTIGVVLEQAIAKFPDDKDLPTLDAVKNVIEFMTSALIPRLENAFAVEIVLSEENYFPTVNILQRITETASHSSEETPSESRSTSPTSEESCSEGEKQSD